VIDQLSPDGRWRWDGVRWQPVDTNPPPRRARKRWLIPLVIGFAILGVLIAGGAWGAATVVNKVSQPGFLDSLTPLPKDFPEYPGAHLLSANTSYGSSGKQVRVVLETPAPDAEVTAFYQEKLNSGDWEVTSTDAATGVIYFRRVSHPASQGQVALFGHGEQTRVEIQVNF